MLSMSNLSNNKSNDADFSDLDNVDRSMTTMLTVRLLRDSDTVESHSESHSDSGTRETIGQTLSPTSTLREDQDDSIVQSQLLKKMRKWRICFVLPFTSLVSLLCLGQIFSFSVFIDPIASAVSHSWSSSAVPTSLSIQGCIGGVTSAVIGPLLNQHAQTVRQVAATGAILFSAGTAASGLAVSLGAEWLFYLSNGLVTGIGYGCLYLVTLQHLMKWFPDKPGLVAGFFGMMLGFGSILFSSLNYFLSEQVDVLGSSTSGLHPPVTLYILAVAAALGSLPFIPKIEFPTHDMFLMLKNPSSLTHASPSSVSSASIPLPISPSLPLPLSLLPPSTPPPPPPPPPPLPPIPLTRLELLRTRQFCQVVFVVFALLTPAWGLISVYSPMLKTIAQTNDANATWYTSVVNCFYTLGRMFWGALSEKLGHKRCYIIFVLGQATIFALMPAVVTYIGFPLFMPLLCTVATLYGGSKVLLAPILSEYLGPCNANSAVGLSLLAISAAALTGPNCVSFLVGPSVSGSSSSSPSSSDYFIFFYSMSALCALATPAIITLQHLHPEDNTNTINETTKTTKMEIQ